MEREEQSISDEVLIRAVQQGDRDAGACLYQRHVDRVHRICYRILLDGSQVADCVQEVWVKVFQQARRIDRERSFASWLNRVAANTAIDYYRRHRRLAKRLSLDAVRIETLPTEARDLDHALLYQRIQEALQEIAIKQRTALVLRYLEGMSPEEIASVLGCRSGTVRTHIRRCLVALRKKLASDADLLGFEP